jgi:hypothetical protein
MMGREKPSVLPVPVRARPTTSRPSSAGFSTLAWMSNRVSMPRFFSAALVISDRGKLSTCIASGLAPERSGTAARGAGAGASSSSSSSSSDPNRSSTSTSA